jgi:hypothetical protein
MYAFPFSPMLATCSVHLILFDLITIIIGNMEYKLCRSSLCDFSPVPCYFIPLGTNILLSALFSHTSHSMSVPCDRLSHFTTSDNTWMRVSVLVLFHCWHCSLQKIFCAHLDAHSNKINSRPFQFHHLSCNVFSKLRFIKPKVP